MKLSALEKFQTIVIQMHDNPDADAISSGYGLYLYFKQRGKNVRLVYGGKYRIQKSNLVMMIEVLHIPVEYVETLDNPELLITVDCQYGEGNVTVFTAKNVAVIDHHHVSRELPKLSEVNSNLGACATLVVKMLSEENFDYNDNKNLATALYYGLMTDTSNFTEIAHPLDRDLRDYAEFNQTVIMKLRNSNLSMNEIEIAGKALLNYDYNEEYRFAIVQAGVCDPNILGFISDLVLEVDIIDLCFVYSVLPFGVKFSVRSCTNHVRANELAKYISRGIGSGGGHAEKAGGFIKLEAIREACAEQGLGPEKLAFGVFLHQRMLNYFKDFEIIVAKNHEIDLTGMKLYRKKNLKLGYVKATEMFPTGTKVCVRTLEADLDMEIHDDIYFMIGIKGEVYPNRENKFNVKYRRLEEPYHFHGEYAPSIVDIMKGENISMLPYARTCQATGNLLIYAKKLDHCVKVFTEWDKERYMLGLAGDYLAVCQKDLHDIYIVDGDIFDKTYHYIGE